MASTVLSGISLQLSHSVPSISKKAAFPAIFHLVLCFSTFFATVVYLIISASVFPYAFFLDFSLTFPEYYSNIRLFNFRIKKVIHFMNPLDIVSLNTIASKLYENVCRPICRKYDLNQTCFDVILFLANNPSHNTARDLCELRGIRTGNASVAIETLAKRGFLTRSQDSSDRRIQRLILTDLAGSCHRRRPPGPGGVWHTS